VSSRHVGVDSEVPPSITNNFENDINSDLYTDFTWINPSMIVDDDSQATPELGGADWSPESSIAEPHTPSQFDAPAIEPSPVACGSFQFSDSFSLSHLYRHSTFDIDHIDTASRNVARPLDEDPVSTSPASYTAGFEDLDIPLCRESTAAVLADQDDEELVRASIKSLDVGEEPVFDLPSGWKEAFSPLPADITAAAPHSSQAECTKKTSVLPRLKSLWKRAASKFVSRSL
jgi:hypothetical protein